MELKNIDHYVCTGECKTVSEKPGICEVKDCSRRGQTLTSCTCSDNRHSEIWQKELPTPAEVPSAPPAVPSPELPPSPIADTESDDVTADLDLDDMGGDTEVEADIDVDVDDEQGGSDEQVTFKTIQKLTGKLTQKIRTLDSEEGMTSENIKYVINMVLSSFNLSELSEEDREDILSKFEDETEDLGGDDMDGEDLTDDSEVEDIQADMDIPMEGDMEEGYEFFAK